jgi:hypothetical protein
MSHEYAMSRVRDALEKAEGNHSKAQRLVLTWIEKDHSLLFGLVAPHLQGIISHAVNHASTPPKKKMPKKINLDEESSDQFGLALVQGMRGTSGNFGEALPRDLSKPGKASQKHIDAINKLASAGKDKGGKKK